MLPQLFDGELFVSESRCVHQKSVTCYSHGAPFKQCGREDEAEPRHAEAFLTLEVADLSSKRQSILIVDPDAASRQLLEELVRSAGYDVAVSSSQAQGFQFVQEASIDLLILSADLADIQCCDALAEVKGNAATSGTRVILLAKGGGAERRSEEHTSELQSRLHLVCRLLLEKKKRHSSH